MLERNKTLPVVQQVVCCDSAPLPPPTPVVQHTVCCDSVHPPVVQHGARLVTGQVVTVQVGPQVSPPTLVSHLSPAHQWYSAVHDLSRARWSLYRCEPTHLSLSPFTSPPSHSLLSSMHMKPDQFQKQADLDLFLFWFLSTAYRLDMGTCYLLIVQTQILGSNFTRSAFLFTLQRPSPPEGLAVLLHLHL